MKSESTFIHTDFNQNLSSPRQIIPILLKQIHPKSVVDIGCGTGRFLRVFKELGITDVLGVDGHWVNRELLKMNIKESEFISSDLENFKFEALNRRFDLAVCLEVAEHLEENYADHLVTNLTGLSDYILFSAAIPFQGGQGHLNEQWPQYWQSKFEMRGYTFCDVLRDELWKYPDVQYWFKQNLFLVIKNEVKPTHFSCSDDLQNYVHPYLYMKKASELNLLKRGLHPVKTYFLLLAKAIAKRIIGR